jgi:TPR repeat protein
VLAVLAVLGAPAKAGREIKPSAPPPAQSTFERGMSALKAGQLDVAVPALEAAAAKGEFLAQYYLARVFSDSTGPYTDHAKAYVLYQRIADEHADIDPDDDQRTPFVAKALTALAGYVRGGIVEIGLKPDAERAVEYLRHSATFFNEPDAQFELAKLELSGEGVQEDVRQAMHWLSVLTQKGHAGAQAFLADLYWRGKYVKADHVRALALVAVATENAPPTEQIWIEDVYQNIFCSADGATRRQSATVLADWRQKYGRPNSSPDEIGLAPLKVTTTRTCSNGEQVLAILPSTVPGETGSLPSSAQREGRPGLMQGSVVGVGLRTAAPAESGR